MWVKRPHVLGPRKASRPHMPVRIPRVQSQNNQAVSMRRRRLPRLALLLLGSILRSCAASGKGATLALHAPMELSQRRAGHLVHAEQGGMEVVRRSLQQEDEVEVVETVEELKKALADRTPHVVIQSHLDLQGEDLQSSTPSILGDIPEAVQSIRGNCAEVEFPTFFDPPDGHVPLLDFLDGQCLLLFDYDLMTVLGSLVLEGLYIRLTEPRDEFETFDEVIWGGPESSPQLWMKEMTLQGNGDGIEDCSYCGLHFFGKVYAEGCTFADFDGRNVVFGEKGALLSLVDCTVTGNTLFAHVWGSAVIQADPHGSTAQTGVRLEGCTFANNTPTLPTLLADNRGSDTAAKFYSDSECLSTILPTLGTVCTYQDSDRDSTPPDCIDTCPLSLAEAGDGHFLTASSVPSVPDTQTASSAAVSSAEPAAAAAPSSNTETTPTDDEASPDLDNEVDPPVGVEPPGGGGKKVWIWGAVGGVALLVGLVILVIGVWWLRNRINDEDRARWANIATIVGAIGTIVFGVIAVIVSVVLGLS